MARGKENEQRAGEEDGDLNGVCGWIVIGDYLFSCIISELDSIEKMRNLTVLEVTPTIFTSAREYVKKFKLMSNDAIGVATYKVYGITTSDRDFERVDFLKVWKP